MKGTDLLKVFGVAVLVLAVVYVVAAGGVGDPVLGARRAVAAEAGGLHGTLFGDQCRVTMRDGTSSTGAVMIDGGKVKVLRGLDVVEVNVAAVKRIERTK